MIQSMTGYGKADCEFAGNKIIAEIKSLNSKQLDLSMRIAPQYRDKDLEIRNLIAKRLERGKVDFALYVENPLANEGHQINAALVENYYWQIKQLADNMKIPIPTNWFELLLKLPDVFKNNETATADDIEWQTVTGLINQAIDRFMEFRTQEGETLQNMFEEKITRIGELLDSIEPYEIERITKIRTRIEENMAILAENSKIDIDRNRLEQEMISVPEAVSAQGAVLVPADSAADSRHREEKAQAADERADSRSQHFRKEAICGRKRRISWHTAWETGCDM